MMRAGAFTLAVAAVLVGVACAQEYDPLHNALGPLPDFTLTDQSGRTIGRNQLSGKVCVVSFFFSCCAKVCPQNQATMARLQERFANDKDVLLVSINVFPTNDTQALIQKYARDHGANPERWLFLRGSEAEIYALVSGGFKQGLARDTSAPPGFEVTHTPNIMVVDHQGTIRGYANGLDQDQVDRLEEFVKGLVHRRHLARVLPAVNASLNGTCGLLLVMGYVLIRGRHVLAHKVCMLAALAVSAVFLACYLFYHFAVLDGQPTRFSGEGAIRSLYLGILLSHTLLAVVVAPLALRVTYLGLRDRLARHRRLARWTLPVWLYVSVTGVVVYWMLYHLYPPA